MGNAKLNSWMQWVLLVGVIVMIYGVYTIDDSQPEPIVFPSIPSAQDVADLIVIPEIPSSPDSFLSLRQDLKADALITCDDEYDFDEIEDLYEDDDEVEFIREYVDDRDYSDISLGIDNLDDREITIDRVYKVAVEEDNGDDYNDRVYIECEVTSDDGNLEADIDYTL